MSGHLEQIRLDSYKPLRELVCEHIRDAIINGVFAPGERLMEIQMADEMGVSRTPVREAIRKLEMEGFVVMIPRRGTYVSNMSIRDINDVYEIRISLDTLAAGLAAERISDEELEELQRLLVKVGKWLKWWKRTLNSMTCCIRPAGTSGCATSSTTCGSRLP